MGIRVLVVDDATFIRDMIKKQLRDRIPGIDVVDAPDGARALAQLKLQSFDLILSDWEMPNITGEELLRTVRAMPGSEHIPFVMISSRGDRSHIIKAIELGVSDYLTKPFSGEELMKKVFKQLKLARKLPPAQVMVGSTQGIAFSSVDVLTGGKSDTKESPEPKRVPAKAARGKAQLRFSNNRVMGCVIREMSLQYMSGLVQRNDMLPGLFEQAVVDVETDEDGSIARVNGYIHSLQAGEGRPDTQVVKVVIRFVDNDAEKFEVLSKYIAQM